MSGRKAPAGAPEASIEEYAVGPDGRLYPVVKRTRRSVSLLNRYSGWHVTSSTVVEEKRVGIVGKIALSFVALCLPGLLFVPELDAAMRYPAIGGTGVFVVIGLTYLWKPDRLK